MKITTVMIPSIMARGICVGAKMPEGFCPWAWIDIYRSVSAMSSGSSNKPWAKKDGQTIVCCTDGVRPVVFCVEAFGENDESVE